jgi:hypothetical protein
LWLHKSMKLKNKMLAAAVFGSLLLYATLPLSAQTHVLPGHVPAVTSQLTPIGPLPADTNLRLAIGLPLRNQAALTDLLQQIYDPASTNYQHYLTPEQFNEQFGPTEQDYQAVIAFAKAHGFTITGTHSNRVLLDVIGSVADIENTLHVKMNTYQHPTENRTFYAPDREPSVDLAVAITDFNGLNNYSLPHPNYVETPPASRQSAGSNAGSGLDGTYAGYDFRDAYLPGVTLTGAGQTVGLLEFDGYYPVDIANYETSFGLPNVTLQNVTIDGFNGVPGGGDIEVSLDIEMAIAMAPGLSKVIVYEAGPDGNAYYSGDWHDILNRMATDNLAKQISCSWFLPGGANDPVAEGIFQEMAAQGQSFFAAAGDADAYTGLIPFPCDSPSITIVGGTTLTTTGAQGSWVSETAWNWGDDGGSYVGTGGGTSTYYGIPYYQQGVSMTANQGSTTMRNIPDVALTADNVLVAANDGYAYDEGGTSCAAPLWAGFTALLNEQAAATGKPVMGFLNPTLYLIGLSSSYASAFHDITTGNNEWPSSPTKFPAVSGYDLSTGWGTPNGQFLSLFLPSWNLTGSLNNARELAAATLLANGQVLVAGGTGYLPSTELYNPVTGKWATTGPLNTARDTHTATLLSNGQVLVAGGYGASGALASAELYNPATGNWTTTGPLHTARYSHTATLLPNGQVLVAGGYGTAGALASAELYNPATGSWTVTGNMNAARSSHIATLLSNGQLLVAGGQSGSGFLSSSELYNPATTQWTTIASPMKTASAFAAAGLLSNGSVLVAGGEGASGATASAEFYNPANGTWTQTGSLNAARFSHTATSLPNGQILVAGGRYGMGSYLASAELYNPVSGTWMTISPMNYSRTSHTATLLPNGQVLVAGGANTSGSLNETELYVP